MEMRPKLEVSQYHGDGRYDYAVFRSDRGKPICSGISKSHANHIKRILAKEPELPETIPPIKDYYNFESIVECDQNGYGIVPNENKT